MFSNLSGWHAMFILTVVVVPLVIIAVAILIVRRSRKATAAPAYPQAGGPVDPTRDASTRLSQLTELRDRGQITEAEYESRRRQILDGL